MHSRIIVRNALTVKSDASRNASYRTKKLVKIRCRTQSLWGSSLQAKKWYEQEDLL